MRTRATVRSFSPECNVFLSKKQRTSHCAAKKRQAAIAMISRRKSDLHEVGTPTIATGAFPARAPPYSQDQPLITLRITLKCSHTRVNRKILHERKPRRRRIPANIKHHAQGLLNIDKRRWCPIRDLLEGSQAGKLSSAARTPVWGFKAPKLAQIAKAAACRSTAKSDCIDTN